jgi:hypothetical protein
MTNFSPLFEAPPDEELERDWISERSVWIALDEVDSFSVCEMVINVGLERRIKKG